MNVRRHGRRTRSETCGAQNAPRAAERRPNKSAPPANACKLLRGRNYGRSCAVRSDAGAIWSRAAAIISFQNRRHAVANYLGRHMPAMERSFQVPDIFLKGSFTMPSQPVRIAYIAGYDAAGSTILDIALGQHAALGGSGGDHLRYTTRWRNNEYCACGKAIRDCSFWSSFSGSGRMATIPD